MRAAPDSVGSADARSYAMVILLLFGAVAITGIFLSISSSQNDTYRPHTTPGRSSTPYNISDFPALFFEQLDVSKKCPKAMKQKREAISEQSSLAVKYPTRPVVCNSFNCPG